MPRGLVSFSRENLGHDVSTFAQEYLTQKGELSTKPGLIERHAFGVLADQARPEIARLLERYGDSLDVRLAARVIDRTKFQMESKKADRRAWWVSGGFFIGALLGFAAAGYGMGLGFKAMFSPKVAEGIQAGWNPVWYTLTGAASGAMTGLFIDKLTSPSRAFINRTGFKGAPIQPGDISSLTREFIFSQQIENNADGRFNGGRWTLTIYEILTSPAFVAAGEEMRAARLSKDPKQKQEAIELAGMFVARRLINSELYWFAFDPSNIEMFDNLRLTLGIHFKLSSPEEIAAFRKAVVDEVRRERKNVDSEGRPKLDEAIKNYYEPFLDRILAPPKQEPKPLEAPVAHAG